MWRFNTTVVCWGAAWGKGADFTSLRIQNRETRLLFKLCLFTLWLKICITTRMEGIEPTYTVLKTVVLPLNYIPEQF